MFIIAGLGNPGKEYENTRHNAGFMAIDALADKLGADVSEKKHKALCGRAVIGGEKVILMKPQTYMNSSGESIRAAADYYKVEPEDILVIYDDISLAPGLAIRPGYSREAVAEWLLGSGRLILGDHPLDADEGRGVDAVEIRESVPGHPDSYAILQPCFVCRPWKYEAIPAPPVPILHGGRGYNPRSGVAAPLIRLRGEAGAALASRCGGRALTAPEAVIDCDWEAAEGCRTGGDFLQLPPLATWQASVTVSAGTISAVTLEPRYRGL